MPTLLAVDPQMTIQMGDAVVVTVDATTELTGTIRFFDYGTNSIMIETTVPNSLQVVKNYLYFTKVLP
jgi:hypothetical protein